MNSLPNISKQCGFGCKCSQKLRLGVVDPILAIFCKGLSLDIKMFKNAQLQITFNGEKCEQKLNKWYCKEAIYVFSYICIFIYTYTIAK